MKSNDSHQDGLGITRAVLEPGTAEAILTAHQRQDYKGCICGWSELGKSHPAHQVAMLREAGLLNDAPTG
jgi:hypothetical protein